MALEDRPVFLDRGARLKLARLMLALFTAVTKPRDEPEVDFRSLCLIELVKSRDGLLSKPPMAWWPLAVLLRLRAVAFF
jgi:hypothetical protein